MSTFLRIDIDIMAMIVLAGTFALVYTLLDKNIINRWFLGIAVFVMIELFCEALSCIINSMHILSLRPLAVFLHIILFINGPFIIYLWCIFVHKWIMFDDSPGFGRSKALLIPLAINIFFTLISLANGAIFSISEQNVYIRGPMYFVPVVTAYYLIFYSFCIIYRQRRRLLKEEYVPLILFGVLPSIGGLLQVIFYGALLMWSSAAFSLVVVFILIQEKRMQLDPLTGAVTKVSFDRYIGYRVYKEKEVKPFGVIFIDLDDFKKINDIYGHMEGDYALKQFVYLIKSALSEKDVIARFGGDEFVVLAEKTTHAKLEELVQKIDMIFEQYNNSSGKPYRLEYSCGYDLFDAKKYRIRQFLDYVDTLMYSNKKNKDIYWQLGFKALERIEKNE